jgi:hypothetical protein
MHRHQTTVTPRCIREGVGMRISRDRITATVGRERIVTRRPASCAKRDRAGGGSGKQKEENCPPLHHLKIAALDCGDLFAEQRLMRKEPSPRDPCCSDQNIGT